MGSEWPVRTIAECASLEPYSTQIGPFGKALMSDEYKPSGVPVLRGVNVNHGRFHDEDFVFIDAETADRLGKFESFPGDVLLVHKGTLGQIGLMPKERRYQRYIMGNSMMRVRCDPTKLLPEYLYYWLLSADGQHYLFSRVSQVGVPQLQTPLTTLRQARLPVPPPSEQSAIVRVLGALDDKIELNNRMSQTLGSMARALFKSWFVDFEHPLKSDLPSSGLIESELGPLPEGWGIGVLGDVAEVIDCSHAKKPERQASGRPLVQLNNISEDGLFDASDLYLVSESDYRSWTARIEASPGDCVITNVGRVGAVAQVPAGFLGALGRNMTAIRCRPNWPFPTFLLQALLSRWIREEISSKTDTGTILDALNVRNIPRLRLAIPPRPVAQRFEYIARPIRRQLENCADEIVSLVQLRNQLLARLLSQTPQGGSL